MEWKAPYADSALAAFFDLACVPTQNEGREYQRCRSPSRKPFLNFLGNVFRYRMRPVPVVLRLFALIDHP